MGALIGLFYLAQKQHWRTSQGLPMSFASHFRYTWTQAAGFLEYQHTYIFNTTRYVSYHLREELHPLGSHIICSVLSWPPDLSYSAFLRSASSPQKAVWNPSMHPKMSET